MDVTRAAGIRFVHFNGATGKKYMPETMGSGCAFADLDNDGWLDVLLLNGRPLAKGVAAPRAALYRNNRDGTFTDATPGSGLEAPLYAMGCCVGDYDNDGWQDLFITTALEPNRLFHNEGNGTFRDVTAQAGVGDRRWGSSCAWVDYDRDGFLDLFVANYVRYRALQDDKWCSLREGHKSYCTPEMYEGESCALYRNYGNGTFSDVSEETGIATPVGKALGVALLDYDDDGWMDIAVANDERPNFLFHNVAGGRRNPHGRRFEEVGLMLGIALDEHGLVKAGMGIDAADVLNDGRQAILVSNFSNEGLSLFRQERTDLFVEIATRVGMREPSTLLLGFGLFFADLDDDGFQDALVANGHVQDDINLLQSTVRYGQRKLLFRNRRDGTFEEVGRQSGAPFAYERVSRSAAYGDYDNDGDLDLLITNNAGPPELLRNELGKQQNWLQVVVRGTVGSGVEDRAGPVNRDAIGTKVLLRSGGATQQRWVRSGSSYLCESMRRLHFGLGGAPRADLVEARFPNGKVRQLRNVRANQVVEWSSGRVVEWSSGRSEPAKTPAG